MRWLPSSRDRAVAARSTDWLWGGVGVSIAGASASFAAYMIVTAPGPGTGSPDFNVFAQFDHRTSRPDVAAAKPSSNRPFAVAAALTVPAAGIDREPTGSIPLQATVVGEPTSVVARAPGQAPLRDFIVRDVFGNRALIEHRQKLSLVRQGSILDGAGEVLSIERRGGSWVVKTAAGVIGGL